MGVLLGLQQLALLAHLSEAVAAVNGTIRLGLEGNLSLTTAGGAGGGEELTGATGGVLASIAAGLAALGLVLEAALSLELLLTGSEGELVAALFTGQNLVFVHGISLSLTRAQVLWANDILRSALAGSARCLPRHFATNTLNGVVHRFLGTSASQGDLAAGQTVQIRRQNACLKFR